MYTFISTSRIAHIELTSHLTFSLQIPIPTSIAHLPTAHEPQYPGLWLTTAKCISRNDEVLAASSSKHLASHFGLLLLSDLDTILEEVSRTNTPLTAPLTHYLRSTSSTKSFLQISQSSGIPLEDIQFLANHLIYWRRARAMPPLHQKDVYIVSPNADMRKLRWQTGQFARRFQNLPALPKILSMIGAGNKPYAAMIPSKDHKPAYMEILTWLMREGLVTQLWAFAWVRVSADVQQRAEREMERERGEEAARAKEASQREAEDSKISGGGASAEHDGESNPHSGYLTPMQSSMYSTTSSASSARTAIPLNGSGGGGDSDAIRRLRETASSLLTASMAPSPHRKLILDPTKASGLEARCLEILGGDIEREEGLECRKAWEQCLKYFNGEHALEKIAVREGWKRKRLEALRVVWARMGILMEVRHW